MKKLILALIGFTAVQLVQAQEFSYGIKIGLATNNLEIEKQETITTDGKSYSYSEGSTKVGFQAGLVGRLTISKFLFQPELYVSGENNEFDLSSIGDPEAPEKFSHKSTRLNIPLLLGAKVAGPLRIMAGPVGSIVLSEDNGLLEVIGKSISKDESNSVTYGYQVGLGVDLSKLTIDLRYEGGLSSFGDGITVGNTTYEYDTRTNQVMLTMGFLL